MRSSNITLLAIAGVATAAVLAGCAGHNGATGGNGPLPSVSEKAVLPSQCPSFVGHYESSSPTENGTAILNKEMTIASVTRPKDDNFFAYEIQQKAEKFDVNTGEKIATSSTSQSIEVTGKPVTKVEDYEGNGQTYVANCTTNTLQVAYYTLSEKLMKTVSVTSGNGSLTFVETQYSEDGKAQNPVTEVWKKQSAKNVVELQN